MRLSSLFLILTLSYSLLGQSPQKGDFIMPITPGRQVYLSGTMGELRSTHFHAGIDVKTGAAVGWPVHVAADGYIQRIRVSRGGYGNALYVAHPHNKSITVYAHLQKFSPEIAAWVREQQYKNESFEVNLFPEVNQFSFKQGEEIAKGGNSGSSMGPHLHFEIRSWDHKALNPLHFGFGEVKDSVAPELLKIAFVPMDAEARINGVYARHEYQVMKVDFGKYVLDGDVYLQGKIGVEVYAFDRLNGASNRNGVPYQSLFLDGKQVFRQAIDEIVFADSRGILMHTNYERASSGGRRFNKLYVDDGNSLEYYETDGGKGVINFNDPMPHQLEIHLSDAYGNISQYVFDVNATEQKSDGHMVSGLKSGTYEFVDNYLHFKTDLSDYGYCEALEFKSDGDIAKHQMVYDEGDWGYYMVDLRETSPDSIEVCHDQISFAPVKMIPSAVSYDWSSPTAQVSFRRKSLFDTLYLRYTYENNERELFDFKNKHAPINQSISVTLKPEQSYNKDRASVYTVNSRGHLGFVGGKWQGDEIIFKTKSFRKYTIDQDTIPPTIQELSSTKGRVRFRVKDKKTGIKIVRAYLNEKWLLMNYDPKLALIWSDDQVDVKGNFKLEVLDQVNNVSLFEKSY